MLRMEQVKWPDWRVVREIGRGSYGAVYEIERDIFGVTEKSALKVLTIPENPDDIQVLRAEGYDDQSITSRLHGYLEDIVREYTLMVRLRSHSNVVYCEDVRYFPHEDGFGWDVYIKMELLTPLINCLDIFEQEQAVIELGIAMCSALVLCRENKIIHRDIKPQNMFVSQDGVFKLGDFGVAKTIERISVGTKVGTGKYMAPEVFHNLPYGPAADQYSLGLVLYWLLNDRRMPFVPKKAAFSQEEEAKARRLRGDLIPPPAHGSRALQEIVLKACAYDPAQRFAGPDEMRTALEALRDRGAASDAGSVRMRTGMSAVVIPERSLDLTENISTWTTRDDVRRDPELTERGTGIDLELTERADIREVPSDMTKPPVIYVSGPTGKSARKEGPMRVKISAGGDSGRVTGGSFVSSAGGYRPSSDWFVSASGVDSSLGGGSSAGSGSASGSPTGSDGPTGSGASLASGSKGSSASLSGGSKGSGASLSGASKGSGASLSGGSKGSGASLSDGPTGSGASLSDGPTGSGASLTGGKTDKSGKKKEKSKEKSKKDRMIIILVSVICAAVVLTCIILLLMKGSKSSSGSASSAGTSKAESNSFAMCLPASPPSVGALPIDYLSGLL